MQEIIVVIDEDGNSAVDLNGFSDGSCGKVMKDFQGGDRVVAEHKKSEYHRQAQATEEERQRHHR